MNKTVLIAMVTFKDSIRNRALYGIFFCGIILFALNIIFTGMFTFELGKVAVDLGLSVVSISGLILIFFFSIQNVFNDIDKKTIYLILSRPVSRTNYITGKYLGLSLILVVSGLVLGLCSALSFKLTILGLSAEAFIPPHFTWPTFFISILFQTIGLLVLLSISMLWTCLTSHSFIAFLLSVLTYFIGQNMEIVKKIILTTEIMSSESVSMKMINFVSWILPNLAVFDLKTTAAYGLPLDFVYLLSVSVYGFSYIGMSIILSVFVFKKRELP